MYVIHSLMSKYVIGGEEEQEDEMGDVLASYETLAFLPNNLEADERSWKLAMRDHSRDIDQVNRTVLGQDREFTVRNAAIFRCWRPYRGCSCSLRTPPPKASPRTEG